MKRREFILGLAGASAFCPFAAFGQRVRPRIGMLSINSPESDARFVAAFKDALQGLGHIEGRTIDIDYRASSGDTKSLTVLAQELIRLNPHVMLANSVTPTRTINRIAPNMPIVCPAFSDAFVPSLATSFAHPSGRVTGVASDVESLIGKLAELVSDIFPDATQIGYLSNPAGGSMGRYEQQIKTVAKAHGMEIRITHAEKRDEIDPALRQLADAKVSAVIIPTNGLLNASRALIVATATDFANAACLWQPRWSCGGWARELRDQRCRKLSASRRLRRQDPQGCRARGPSDRVSHQNRACHQSEDGQGTWRQDAGNID